MSTHRFELDFSVRDYECDLQGVVNNANYMHYLEHTRHEFLKTLNIDFAALHEEGTDPMVIRAEMDYKLPLTSGDRFRVSLDLEASGKMRFLFHQNIYREADGQLVLKAIISAAITRNGRPIPFEKAFSPEEYSRFIGQE